MKNFIGRWVTPSGNACEVSTLTDRSRVGHVNIVWENYPPSPDEVLFYTKYVLPAIVSAGLKLKEAGAL